MLLNQLAAAGYSYNVVYYVRDIIKAALAEAVDQDVLERNVARKTVIPEIEGREKRFCRWSGTPNCWPVFGRPATAPSSSSPRSARSAPSSG